MFLFGKNSKSDFVPAIMLLVSMVLLLATRLDESIITLTTYALVLFAITCHIYIFRRLKNSILYRRFMKLGLVLSLIYLFNMFVIGNMELKQVLIGTIVSSSIAMLIFFFNIGKRYAILCFGIVLAVFIYRWFILNYDAEEITVNSRNYISYFLYLYSLPIVFCCYKKGTQPFFIVPIIILIMAIIAIGRGGIIMSLLFVIGWLLMKAKMTKHKILFYFILVLVLLSFSSVVATPDFFDLYFSRFEERGLDSSVRTDGWLSYLNDITNPLYFITGYPLRHDRYIFSILEGSPHNSYINFHARAGIFCLFIFFCIIKVMIAFLKQKNYLLLFFFLGLLIKGITDADFPCTGVAGDIYIYILLLIYLESRINRNYKIS